MIWGQCGPAIQTKLKILQKYEEKIIDSDCEWLLTSIKNVMYSFKERCDIFLSMAEARATLDLDRQNKNALKAVYYDKFKYFFFSSQIANLWTRL